LFLVSDLYLFVFRFICLLPHSCLAFVLVDKLRPSILKKMQSKNLRYSSCKQPEDRLRLYYSVAPINASKVRDICTQLAQVYNPTWRSIIGFYFLDTISKRKKRTQMRAHTQENHMDGRGPQEGTKSDVQNRISSVRTSSLNCFPSSSIAVV